MFIHSKSELASSYEVSIPLLITSISRKISSITSSSSLSNDNFYSKKYEYLSNKTEHAVYSYTVGKPESIAIVILLSNAKNAQ